MKSIDLSSENRIQTAEYTSRGNQPKWKNGDYWYKQDYMGYEAMAEVIASRILSFSNIDNFVEYKPVMITTDGFTRAGCMSRNFLGEGESLIPINKLHRLYDGQSLAKAVSIQKDLESRLIYTVDFVSRITGIKEFGQYLSALLEFDAIIQNEDRHFNNIAVIYNINEDKYRLCPFFDNGLSFLSDLKLYPLDADSYLLCDKPKGKPFEQDYEVQVQACRNLFGSAFEVSIQKQDLSNTFEELSEYYRDDIITRAQNIVYFRLNRCGII